MTEYLMYKEEHLFNKASTQTGCKYICEVTGDNELEHLLLKHPYTDDDPLRLFKEIASMYKSGDVIKTITHSEICDMFGGEKIIMKGPLSHDEMKFLMIYINNESSRNKS